MSGLNLLRNALWPWAGHRPFGIALLASALLAGCAHPLTLTRDKANTLEIIGTEVLTPLATCEVAFDTNWKQAVDRGELSAEVKFVRHGTHEVLTSQTGKQRYRKYGVGEPFVKAFLTPFYVGILGPLIAPNFDRNGDGKKDAIEWIRSVFAHLNLFEASPLTEGTSIRDVLVKSKMTEKTLTRSEPAAYSVFRIVARSAGREHEMQLASDKSGKLNAKFAHLLRDLPDGDVTLEIYVDTRTEPSFRTIIAGKQAARLKQRAPRIRL